MSEKNVIVIISVLFESLNPSFRSRSFSTILEKFYNLAEEKNKGSFCCFLYALSILHNLIDISKEKKWSLFRELREFCEIEFKLTYSLLLILTKVNKIPAHMICNVKH